MKRSLFLLWICLATAGCLFQSCYDESNKYGNGLVSSAFRNISTDTSTVTVAAMLIDSLETSGKELVLLGEYTHPVWGKMSASGYVSYNRPSYNTDIDERVVLDSLMLTFRYGGYYIGDTLKALRFNVHRLTQKLRLGDNGYLYNTSSFTYEAEPLASHSFIPRPNSGEEVEVRLPDEMGQDFLTRFHSRDVQVNSDYFEDYFKGLVVIPEGADNQSLLSFQVADSSAVLVLHYHIIDEKENEQEPLRPIPAPSSIITSMTGAVRRWNRFLPGRRKSLPPNWITGVFCLADWDGMPAWNFLISIISLCRESRWRLKAHC